MSRFRLVFPKMGSVLFGSVPLGSVQRGSLPPGSLPPGSVQLGSVQLASVLVASVLVGSVLVCASAITPALAAEPPAAPTAPIGQSPILERARILEASSPRLYTVATAHLDTQWRWTIRETIEKFIPATMRDNFALFEKYPGYNFTFEGAFRYQLMKEYYPEDYERLRRFIAENRWHVGGSWVDAVDVNIPSPESLFRHALYGNGFYRREFGRTSRDVFLPDCFGFGYALPSIAAHSGLLGFSTQKLTWGSAYGVPFDVGLWEGVDGSTLVASLKPGSYTGRIEDDLSADSTALAAVHIQGKASGLFTTLRYFGTGDQGGAPAEESVNWLERSLHGHGPIQVLSVASDQLARDIFGLPPRQRERLPRYKGELVMTDHGVGCYTSQAAMKRWNRRNERLADAAERACVAADQLGGLLYPREALREAWVRFLWHQFHDDVTGTSIPEAYYYSWNDEALSQNQFAGVLQDGVGCVTRGLDTRVTGQALVVYNPLSIDREDLVEAAVVFPGPAPSSVRVFGPDGRETPSQILGRSGSLLQQSGASAQRSASFLQRSGAFPQRSGSIVQRTGGSDTLQIAFLARVPSIGFAVFDVRPSEAPCSIPTGLSASVNSLENPRYRIRLDQNGDVASIFDKAAAREILRSPLRLQLLDDEPSEWPSWEIDYEDIMARPRQEVGGPARVRVLEKGPARISLEVTREVGASTFVQILRLAAGGAGATLVMESRIDWRSPGTLLKAAFPLALNDPTATYDLGLGTIQRGVNRPKLYEVPGQQWADLTEADGSFGVAVLNDCKYGWDRPDARTLRLSLLHTPRVNRGWTWTADQGSQDLGRHTVATALFAHGGGWQNGVSWEADRLNQPLRVFQTPEHDGNLGRRYSVARLEGTDASRVSRMEKQGDLWRERRQERRGGHVPKRGREESETALAALTQPTVAQPTVAIRALKKMEETEEVLVRLQELTGRGTPEVRLSFAEPIEAFREVNAAEEPIDAERGSNPAELKRGDLVLSFGPYQPRSFALRLRAPRVRLDPPPAEPVDLPYNLDWVSRDGEAPSELAGSAALEPTLAGELVPPVIWTGGIPFRTGSSAPAANNVVACGGQRLAFRAGSWNRLYLLAAATEGDRAASVRIDDRPARLWIQDYAEPIAQWDSRLRTAGLITEPAAIPPAYAKPARVGWVGTHRHDTRGKNEPYQWTQAFVYRIDLPDPPGLTAAHVLTLPSDSRVRILAATVARNENDAVRAAAPLIEEPDQAVVRIESARHAFVDSIDVGLNSPNQDAVLRYTTDGTEPTGASSLYTHPFRLTESSTVQARAFAPGLRSDFVARAEFAKLTPRPSLGGSLEAGSLEAGLLCRYYEGGWRSLPEFASLPPLRTIVLAQVGVPEFARAESMGVTLTGFLRIPKEGVYTLSLRSDDGSVLFLGQEKLIDSDGLHGETDVRAEVALEAGLHPVRIEYFQLGGDVALGLWMDGPDLPMEPVAASRFAHRPGSR